jgi:hypothetical protein
MGTLAIRRQLGRTGSRWRERAPLRARARPPPTRARCTTSAPAHGLRLYNRPHERPWDLHAAATRQRADQVLRTRVARTRRAAGTPPRDGRRANPDPTRHRRKRRPHGRDVRSRHATPEEPRSRRCEQGRPGARPGGDRRRAYRARRLVAHAVARARCDLPSRLRAARRSVALDTERRDDAQPVEDGAPGGDRRRGRDGHFWRYNANRTSRASTPSSPTRRRASGIDWSTARSRASSSRSARSTSRASAGTSRARRR